MHRTENNAEQTNFNIANYCLNYCTKSLPYTIGGMSLLTVFIIGCVAAAGILAGPNVGIIAAALGGGGYALALIGSRDQLLKQKAFLVITIAAMITTVVCAGLMLSGALTAAQLGYALIGIPLAVLPLNCCACAIHRHQIKEDSKKAMRQGFMLGTQIASALEQ